jgi:uncharacterized protein (DUF849 family)
MTVPERLAASLRFKPEICSLNMGSLNFAFHQIAERVRDWRFDWERGYIEGSEDVVFRNSFRDIKFILTAMSDYGTRYEHECYDIGHLYNLAYFLDKGLVRPPLFIQSVFGILGGIGADPENLTYMKQTADRLFGADYVWSVLAAGRHQMPLVTEAAVMGAHVRVGLEDSLYIGRGALAQSNAEQVTKIRRILNELSLEAATPAETRELLALKGRAEVSIKAA